MKQETFFKFDARFVFGGSLIKRGTGPRRARPLDSKMPIHLVLRAERSAMRIPRHFARVNDIVAAVVRKYGVRLYAYANVGNHLHLLIKLPRRTAWNGFIREVTGRVALVTGVRWLHRPFTRVVRGWRRAYRVVKSYVEMNQWEAESILATADKLSAGARRRRWRESG